MKKQSHRATLKVRDGVVLIGSDPHYWPGIVTTAHKAFVKFAGKLKPKAIVLNGDVIDGATVSRHASIGWEHRPKLSDEIKAAQKRLREIQDSVLYARFIWPLGNHDERPETKLAANVPEFADVPGVHLKDHFPDWEPCWSLWINNDVIIKHRLKGGIHATHNNALWTGMTCITGHDHMLKVTPVADYKGTRWGVSTGTLADPYGPQFVNYTEDSPKNWSSGFVVLTFKQGKLLWPEVVHVVGKNKVSFRGEIIKV